MALYLRYENYPHNFILHKKDWYEIQIEIGNPLKIIFNRTVLTQTHCLTGNSGTTMDFKIIKKIREVADS